MERIFHFQYKRSSSSSGSGRNNIGSGEETSSSSSNIRGPYNANILSRYVELVLVMDMSEYEKHGHDVTKLYQRCKDIANIVNAVCHKIIIFCEYL